MDWEEGLANLIDDVIRVSAQKYVTRTFLKFSSSFLRLFRESSVYFSQDFDRIVPGVLNSFMGSQGRTFVNDYIQKILHDNTVQISESDDESRDRRILQNPEFVGINVFWTIMGGVMMLFLFLIISIVTFVMYKARHVQDIDSEE